jgi:hypothetical protein
MFIAPKRTWTMIAGIVCKVAGLVSRSFSKIRLAGDASDGVRCDRWDGVL